MRSTRRRTLYSRPSRRPRENALVRALGIDVGGTFTDAVLVSDGTVTTAKVPTRRRQEESVVQAAEAGGHKGGDRLPPGARPPLPPVRRSPTPARPPRALRRRARPDGAPR